MTDRRTFVASAAALLAGCAAWPQTHAASGRLVELRLVDRTGDALPSWRHRGSEYVAGRPGDRYAVRLTNRSGGRVLVVLSVDGVNAISGETASTSQSGYVLAPWQSAEISGWRKSDTQAAAFYFTALPDAYASRTGRPQNVGVIGAAVFRERVVAPPPPYDPIPYSSRGRDDAPRSHGERRAAAPAAGAADAGSAETAAATTRERDVPSRAERLGTGHGEREYSPISRTSFERANAHPNEIVQVRYDSEANLAAAGIVPRRGADPFPVAFPGYVPDPPRH